MSPSWSSHTSHWSGPFQAPWGREGKGESSRAPPRGGAVCKLNLVGVAPRRGRPATR